jgi:molecular chaperone DnaK
MEHQTVDFGIDLGTTNSAIARANPKGGVEILRNRARNDTTPSAVARTSKGQTLVGQEALDKIDLNPALQFKREMGTTNWRTLADGAELPAEELSAEVLKKLKELVQLRYATHLEHVVITVPAMFQQPQCEATHRAAGLAGLTAVALLQEPIAAATAYLNENPEEGDYLVYDLGGGTFDVSLVRLRDAEMSVVAHGGDNYLGGADFDREIFDWVLRQLETRYDAVPDLRKPPHCTRLLRECEEARKRLSTEENSFIDLGDFELPVAQLALDRERLELLIEPLVSRTISLARERIEKAGLKPQDVRSILLVGGPTMTPYIRRRLKEELAIPLCLDQDPMTVVAKGAAIHASSLLKPDRAAAIPAPGSKQVCMELFYDPVCPDTRTTVSGHVVDPTGFAGEVRLSRSSGDWETGWIPLRNGAFACEVQLRPNNSVEFRLSLRDLTGNIWTVSPGTIAVRNGIAAASPVAPYNYGIVLHDKSVTCLVEEGTSLPAVGRHDFSAAKTVPAGSDEELVVYFVEGNSRWATDNTKVGELRIRGQDLRRTLREGDNVDVRIHQDQSRLLKARVSIPLHDLDYDVEFHSMKECPPIEDLEASLEEVRGSLAETRDVVASEDETDVLQCLRDLEQAEAALERVEKGEMGEVDRAASKISTLRQQMRPLVSKYELQARHRDAIESIDDAERITREANDAIGLATTGDLRKEADKCLRLEDAKGLAGIKERADALFRQHYFKTDEFWIGWVQYLRDQRRFATDPWSYDECVKRAGDCLQRGDREGVRVNCLQAMTYLPKEEAQKSRFWDAGLRA